LKPKCRREAASWRHPKGGEKEFLPGGIKIPASTSCRKKLFTDKGIKEKASSRRASTAKGGRTKKKIHWGGGAGKKAEQ